MHVLDAAPVYRLALEKGPNRARYHAVAEEGVTAKAIAEAIGRGLKIPVVSLSPEQAAGHFGWMAMFAGMDMPASSKLTQERLRLAPDAEGRDDRGPRPYELVRGLRVPARSGQRRAAWLRRDRARNAARR